jgi:hypothetical protein
MYSGKIAVPPGGGGIVSNTNKNRRDQTANYHQWKQKKNVPK